MIEMPRSEYPRPQFVRDEWLCLNGNWEFEIDSGDSGLERGFLETSFSDEIVVPFCPESSLSGIENVDFMNVVWYRKTVEVPAGWADKNVNVRWKFNDEQKDLIYEILDEVWG